MRKTVLSTGCYYHVYNRGVDKRDVFLGKNDYFRFLRSLQEFNQEDQNIHLTRSLKHKKNCVGPKARQRSKALGAIVAYCLMPNHFHLLVRQDIDKGISKWMQKACSGYTTFFNLKYERSGALFQGPFKAKSLDHDSDLLQLSRYIHLNPEKSEGYPWSSLQFYLDSEKHCLLKLDKSLILSQVGSEGGYRKFIFEEKSSELLNPFLRIDEN